MAYNLKYNTGMIENPISFRDTNGLNVENIVSLMSQKAEELGVPFVTWSAEELEQVRSEDGFTESAFVRSVAGVGNVCERSALKGAGTSRLLIRKTAHNGVTVAAAVKDYTVCMED